MNNTSKCRSLLQKMGSNWSQRAKVKKDLPNLADLLDSTKPDFRRDLLPFKDHPDFQEASAEMQSKILSCGWLIYNHKTTAIELKIVNPICEQIIDLMLPGVDNAVIQEIVTETLVDESYHVQLVNKACMITRQQRELEFLRSPQFNLVLNLRREQERYQENWQKQLIGLATAVVSEVFISDYLKMLAYDTTIQPLNRMIVDTHRMDEQAHSCIFKNLIKCIYSELTLTQREFFFRVLPLPIKWFADKELEVWKAMLEQIGFSKAETLYHDCAAANRINLISIDYTDVTKLAQELEPKWAEEIFAREALLN